MGTQVPKEPDYKAIATKLYGMFVAIQPLEIATEALEGELRNMFLQGRLYQMTKVQQEDY
jgi:hypothetical protein